MKKIWNWLRNGWNRIGAAIALTILIVFLASCSPPTKAYESHLPFTVMDWSQHNVMNINADNGGVGSGWWVDNETFVTACHVVGIQLLSYSRDGEGPDARLIETEVDEIQSEAQVANNDFSTVLNLKVQSCNFDTDVAVLKRQWLRSDSEFTALPSQSAEAFYGEKVYCAGYGMMANLHITEGHYMGPQNMYDEPWNLITCPTIFGDSGSPALVLRDGRVYWIGMRNAVANAMGDFVEHMTMSAPYTLIEEEIKR